MKIPESKDRASQIGDVIGVLMFGVLGVLLAKVHNTPAAALCICILHMILVDQTRLQKIHMITELGDAMLSRLDALGDIEKRKEKLKDYNFMETK